MKKRKKRRTSESRCLKREVFRLYELPSPRESRRYAHFCTAPKPTTTDFGENHHIWVTIQQKKKTNQQTFVNNSIVMANDTRFCHFLCAFLPELDDVVDL